MKNLAFIALASLLIGTTFTSCRDNKEKSEKEEIIQEMKDEGAEVKIKEDDSDVKIKMETDNKEVKIKEDDGDTKIKIDNDN
tara:strand:+ start:56090 stop:56335 length:246 start_codon:yes stop_codon:yes gene_type:complete